MDDDASARTEAAFDALGDETRVAILRAFDPGEGEPVSFSELRERVGVRDSGRFNYHLEALLGQFVRKTDEGYELTMPGHRVYGAILAGAYTGSEPFDPIPIEEGECPLCGGPLELRHSEEGQLVVLCAACEEWKSMTTVPPSLVEGRDREAVPEVFGRHLATTVAEVVAGICPLCTGPIAGGHEHQEPPEEAALDAVEMAVYECERCGNRIQSTLGMLLLDHPAVVSFYHDHGVDLRTVPLWTLPLAEPTAATLVQEDPVRVRVSVEHDGERLDVTLDGDLSVVGTERTAV